MEMRFHSNNLVPDHPALAELRGNELILFRSLAFQAPLVWQQRTRNASLKPSLHRMLEEWLEQALGVAVPEMELPQHNALRAQPSLL
jgi:hypothetical protein